MLAAGALPALVRATQRMDWNRDAVSMALRTMVHLATYRCDVAAAIVAAGGLEAVAAAVQRTGHFAGITLLRFLARSGGFDVQAAISRSRASMTALLSMLQAPQQPSVEAAAAAMFNLLLHMPAQSSDIQSPSAYSRLNRLQAHCQRVAASGAVPVLVRLVERSPGQKPFALPATRSLS